MLLVKNSLVFALVLFLVAVPVRASDPVEGKIVEVGNGKITVMDKEGKNQYTHVVAADAKISYDGKDCRLDDLSKGAWATINTEKRGEKTVVVKITAKKSRD